MALDDHIQTFIFSYRTTPNSNAPENKSPAELLQGRKLRTALDMLKPELIRGADP